MRDDDTGPRVLPCGDRALLVEVADGAGVPAARTVLVRLDRPPADTDRALLRRLPTVPAADRPVPGAAVQLDVVFDGPDLAEVAERVGRPVAAVVDDLTGAGLEVAFGGFAPGFGYLTGLPPHLHVPRRATPRTGVPAGSVALAGPYAGVYPQASPGGWQLVGRTDAVLFDPDRDPPALLRPGVRVRFRRAG